LSDDHPEYRAVVWRMASRTVMLGGNGFSDDEMLEIASALRTPTDDEWSSMTASARDYLEANGVEPDDSLVLTGPSRATELGRL